MSILNERSRRISSLLGRTLLNSARIFMADMYLDVKTLVLIGDFSAFDVAITCT